MLNSRRKDGLEHIHIHRLEQIFKRAALNGGNGRLHRTEGGDNHHRNVGVISLDGGQDIQAAETGKLNVQNNHVSRPAGEFAHTVSGIGGGLRLETHRLGQFRKRPADARFVVDYQDVRFIRVHFTVKNMRHRDAEIQRKNVFCFFAVFNLCPSASLCRTFFLPPVVSPPPPRRYRYCTVSIALLLRRLSAGK